MAPGAVPSVATPAVANAITMTTGAGQHRDRGRYHDGRRQRMHSANYTSRSHNKGAFYYKNKPKGIDSCTSLL